MKESNQINYCPVRNLGAINTGHMHKYFKQDLEPSRSMIVIK